MLLSTVNAFNLSCQPNRTKKNKSKVIHAGEHCWFKEGECANPLIKTNERGFFSDADCHPGVQIALPRSYQIVWPFCTWFH